MAVARKQVIREISDAHTRERLQSSQTGTSIKPRIKTFVHNQEQALYYLVREALPLKQGLRR